LCLFTSLSVKNAESILRALFQWEEKKMSPALTAGAKIYKNYSLLLELVEAAAASALPPTAARLVRLKRAAHVNRQSLPSLYYQLFPEKPAT